MCQCGKEDKLLECFKFRTLFVVFKWHHGSGGVKMQPLLLLLLVVGTFYVYYSFGVRLTDGCGSAACGLNLLFSFFCD